MCTVKLFLEAYSVAQKMTIFNLLVLVLVLVFSTESMADSVAVFQDQCESTFLSQEGLASSRNPRGRHIPTYSPSYSYDELLLVLQWPTSFCNINDCDAQYRLPNSMPHKFTVHGLWFNKNRASVCCRSPIRPSLQIGVSSVEFRQMMHTHWPNLLNQANPGIFWAQEYAKHGSCVRGFQTTRGFQTAQVVYFQTALDIAERVFAGHYIGDVSAMRLHSVNPLTLVSGHYYHVTHFAPVTIGSGTFYPSLRCSSIKGKVPGQVIEQLQEIVFCTNINGEPIFCSPHVQNCNGRFLFP